MSKKFNQLDPISDANAKNDSYLLAQANPVTGVAEYMTVAQAKEVYATKKLKYVAIGTEGSSLAPPQLLGYQILLIVREGAPLHEVGSSPDSSEFTWNDTTIGLGAPVSGAGERFTIIYRTY